MLILCLTFLFTQRVEQRCTTRWVTLLNAFSNLSIASAKIRHSYEICKQKAKIVHLISFIFWNEMVKTSNAAGRPPIERLTII